MTAHIPVVVLDPGHGGHTEEGASSPNNTSGGGLLEKDLNLDIARRVRERIAHRATVYLTRDSDSNLSLAARAGFARAMGADVFVSLHCNGHVDPARDTTEVYVRRAGGPDQEEFGRALQQAVSRVTGAVAGGVVEADLGVLLADRHAPATLAALVELFDLTHPARARQAASVAFLDRVAAAVAEAIEARLPPTAFPLSRAAEVSPALGPDVSWAHTPHMLRTVAALRSRGVPEQDIQAFLAELAGPRPPSTLGLPRARVLDDGRSTVELPPVHLLERWQEELITAALSAGVIGPLLPALHAVADTYEVTIGIGPGVAGGLGIGAGAEAGLVIAPERRIGYYGAVSALVGVVMSISLTMSVTVVFGGPENFSGSMITADATADTGLGDGVAAHVLISPRTGGVVGVAGEVGVTAGLSPVEAFARFQYTATTLGRGRPTVGAQSIDTRVEQVLRHIKSEAARRAAAGIPMPPVSTFMTVLRSRYLRAYLASPDPAGGRAAVADIGAQNTSGTVTEVCGAPDQWERGTPQYNDSPVPPWLRLLPGVGDLPENFGAATEIITVANRRALPYIDLPFLIGRRTVDELDCTHGRTLVTDADLRSNNGINTSQLMHWATGVRFGAVSRDLLRDLFIGYELWHQELWDIFGHDPVNDLIVEDAGRHLAGLLLTGSVSAADLDARVAEGFRQARAWVGGLLGRRTAQLDAQITAAQAPTSVIHWVGEEIGPTHVHQPYPSPCIRQLLADGRSVEEVERTGLVENYIAVYTLVFEAAAAPPDLTTFQCLAADGALDDAFRIGAEAGSGRPSSLIGGESGATLSRAAQSPAPSSVPVAPGSPAQVGVFGQQPWGYLFVSVADMVPGIDVSHYQGTIDWAQVAAAGKGFALIKATEGATWQDARFDKNWAGALAAGIPRGAYHLLKRPTSSTVDAQVRNFLNRVTLREGDLPPALDVEHEDMLEIIADLGVTDAWRHIWDWCEGIREATGYRPLLYLSRRGVDALQGNLGSLPALELWIAAYREVTRVPPLPEDGAGHLAFPHWSVWQHSESGRVPGIGTDVDLDLFNGDAGRFADWLASVQPGAGS